MYEVGIRLDNALVGVFIETAMEEVINGRGGKQ